MAALTLLSSACAKDPWVQPAQQGNLVELTKTVNAARAQSSFNAAKLRRLAQDVAERELAAASDPANLVPGEAIALDELSPCACALNSALKQRAARGDDTAGAARLSLVTAGSTLEASAWQQLAASPFGWERAAAARDSDPSRRWRSRDQALQDPDARVRQAALLSVLQAPAQEHRDALVGLLRRAPDPLSRQRAAKALGILGGDESYRALTDAWPHADVELRLAIINAFAQRMTFDAGGADQLIALAQSAPGIVGVAAAVSLAKGQTDARNHGTARITRTLESGSSEEQRLALTAAEWSLPEQAKQLVRLGLRGDELVRVAALERWLERPDHQWTAITYLRELSVPATSAAILARSVLAERKDWSIAPQLREQQRYASLAVRAQAARDLLRLGDYSAVALSLVDDAPQVRLKTACWVLAER